LVMIRNSYLSLLVLIFLACIACASDEAVSTSDDSDESMSETVEGTASPTQEDTCEGDQCTLDDAVDAASSLHESDEEVGEEFVFTLTDDNFMEFIKSHDRTLVEFYAPWCGHCKALAPKYEEAARILNDKNANTVLAKMDATENPVTTSEFEIQGYPMMVFLEKGMQTEYDGGREVNDIVDWVMNRDVDPIEIITHEQFEKMKTEVVDLKTNPEREFEIFAFVRKGSKRDKSIYGLAHAIRGKPNMKFYKIHRKKGDPNDLYRVVLRRNNRQQFGNERLDGVFEATYTGRVAPSKKSIKSMFSFDKYDLGTWLQEHLEPFFIDLDARNPPDGNPNGIHPYSLLYLNAKIPRGGLIMLRVPPKDDPEVTNRDEIISKLKEDLIDTVQELRANDGFLVVLSSKDLDQIGFESGVQMLLIHKKVMKIPKVSSDFQAMYSEPNMANPSNHFLREHHDGYQYGKGPKETVREYRYQWSGDDITTLDGEGLKQFVKESIVDGTTTRWIRSTVFASSDPEFEAKWVSIGAKDFEEVVLDKKSDVLVLYCTEWNRYCSELMAEYNKLAEHVNTYYKGKQMKIVYMDCDENDVDDVRVNALPTMILYPAGTDEMYKGKMLQQEHRTVDDIVDFLDEFAVNLNKDEL